MRGASARMSTIALEITNDSPDELLNLDVTIRQRPDSTPYVQHVERVNPRQTIQLALINFADRDGNRFDPFKQKAQAITLEAAQDGRLVETSFSQ
jgi:hypothetical protein